MCENFFVPRLSERLKVGIVNHEKIAVAELYDYFLWHLSFDLVSTFGWELLNHNPLS
jgi:hypothetical protein